MTMLSYDQIEELSEGLIRKKDIFCCKSLYCLSSISLSKTACSCNRAEDCKDIWHDSEESDEHLCESWVADKADLSEDDAEISGYTSRSG